MTREEEIRIEQERLQRENQLLTEQMYRDAIRLQMVNSEAQNQLLMQQMLLEHNRNM